MDTIQSKLAHKGLYITSIEAMQMSLLELQDNNKEAKKLKSEELPENWEDIKEMLYYHGLPSILKVIYSKLISRHHANLPIGHFEIE